MLLETAIVSAAYGTYVLATTFRCVVQLRLVLLASTIGFLAFGLVAEIPAVVGWNVAFGALNAWHLVRLGVARRPVRLSPVEMAGRDSVFGSAPPGDFAALWRVGTIERLGPGELVSAEADSTDLLLILDGAAQVTLGGTLTATLGPGDFVGETGLVSTQPALTTVTATSAVTIHRWRHRDLDRLAERRPGTAAVLWRALGRNLVVKQARQNLYRGHCPGGRLPGHGADPGRPLHDGDLAHQHLGLPR